MAGQDLVYLCLEGVFAGFGRTAQGDLYVQPPGYNIFSAGTAAYVGDLECRGREKLIAGIPLNSCKFSQCGCGSMYRVVCQVRVGHMSLLALDAQFSV